MKEILLKTKEYAVKNKNFFIFFAALLPGIFLKNIGALSDVFNIRNFAWVMVALTAAAGITVLGRCFEESGKGERGAIIAIIYFLFYFGIQSQTQSIMNYKLVLCAALIIAGLDIIISEIPSAFALPFLAGSIFISPEMSIICLPAAASAGAAETVLCGKEPVKKRQSRKKEEKKFLQKFTEKAGKLHPAFTAVAVGACWLARLIIYLTRNSISPLNNIRMFYSGDQLIQWICSLPFLIVLFVAYILAVRNDRAFIKPFIITVAATVLVHAIGFAVFGAVIYANVFVLSSVLAGGAVLIITLRKKPMTAKVLAEGAKKCAFALLLLLIVFVAITKSEL